MSKLSILLTNVFNTFRYPRLKEKHPHYKIEIQKDKLLFEVWDKPAFLYTVWPQKVKLSLKKIVIVQTNTV